TDTLLGLARQVGAWPAGGASREPALPLSARGVRASGIMALTLQARGLPAQALTRGQAGTVPDGHLGSARTAAARPHPLLPGLARQVGAWPAGGASRELDLLLSCGEVIASGIMALTLQARGLPAQALTGGQAGIITDGTFGSARIEEVRPDRLLALLAEGIIPVVAGFQGVTADGEVTTLGRGGSDTTAAALGVALQAERVEIYTDVDGMKAADPRLLPEAPTLQRVTYREAMEMAYLGARVVHPRAVEIAM